MQGARVVGDVHQQVKACGGCKGLIPPWTKLVDAALQVVSHLKLTAGAETGESSLIMGTFSKQIVIFVRVVRKTLSVTVLMMSQSDVMHLCELTNES